MLEMEGFVLTGKHAIMIMGWRKAVLVKLPEEQTLRMPTEAPRTDEVKI